MAAINDIGAAMSKLVKTALAQDKLSGLSAMLGVIAEAVDAQIAILWQVAPKPVDDEIFILAEWFYTQPETRRYYHAMPFKKRDSHTGYVISSMRRPMTIGADWLKSTLNKNEILSEVKRFLTVEFAINSFISIPLELSGEKCALNLYRNTGEPFKRKDGYAEAAQQLTELLPQLYQALTDKVAYCLVDKVNKLLQKLDLEQGHGSGREGNISAFKKVCEEVAAVLQVHETLLYLCEDLTEGSDFKLTTGIWPEPFNQDIENEYKASNERGLTGWILCNKRPVRIFDLASYDKFKDKYNGAYPGLRWNIEKLAIIQKTVREQLNIPNNNDLPPLSFMGAPVIGAGKLLGAIRCSTSKNAPYYFSNEKEKLLCLVADQIGQAWYNLLTQRIINDENVTWHRLSSRVTQLNNTVLADDRNFSSDEVYRLVLDIINETIPGSEISAIRLIDPSGNFLYFKGTKGDYWEQGTQAEILRRKERVFLLAKNDDIPQSLGALVVKETKAIIHHKNQEIDPRCAAIYDDVFSYYQATSVIVAPIVSQNMVIGVLDTRSTTILFSDYAKTAVELLGIQLGLYLSFLKAINALEEQRERQTRSYEDFNHQLKSPIYQLYGRSHDVYNNYQSQFGSDKFSKQLLYLRGLSGKALRVSGTLRMFADLVQSGRIKSIKSLLTEEVLVKWLIESAMDQECLIYSYSGIRFIVLKRDSKSGSRFRLEADIDLLKQAVGNLLDNAAKYSYKGTEVLIQADVTNSGKHVHITVSNHGLPLTSEDAKKCVERGWRSNDAKATTGEGSGIGLWVVDHIMKAHDGELRITPTVKGGKTEVKLLFPIR